MENKGLSKTVGETYRLYTEGFSIPEIANQRGFVESTIYSHFADLILNKLIELDKIVEKEKKEEILEILKENDVEGIKEIKELVNESITYGEIVCVLAFVKLQGNNILANIVAPDMNKSQKSEIFTVGELTKYIKNLLESDKRLSNLFVKGEISNLTFHNSGHTYFSLKDKESQIRCVLFRRVGEDLKFNLKHGMKIIVRGDIEIYKPRGEYSIIVEEIQPDGLGSLNLAFIQLKEKLEKEGLFRNEYKKVFPKFPKTIGIITSPTGAAVQDMLNVIKRRYPVVKVLIAPTLVQGEGATNSIIQSIKLMNEASDVDSIILGRGGGSLEDLWCFNEESVARAIFESKIPIISAVGHETDFTIADFVADYRAPTPSAAAEKIVPDIKEIQEHINHLEIRCAKSLYHKLRLCRSNLNQIMNKYVFKKPTEFIHSNYRELDQIAYQLQNNIKRMIETKRKDLEINESKIIALNPQAILERGYSIVMNKDKILINSSDVEKGEDINIILHGGKIDAKVKKTWKN
ncbi:exodeoxyribonuclease VII large subunit [archaeon]|nr:exodeoxyribonuclease VII large subunit [archaeon]MBT4241489.1 exodeoxyribonuclease VII large subunit [archaeon]MBT4417640.1 exodeoxyribonuclease VII large subunit [archaeon]